MLVTFSVQNFRSFATRQTISMVPSTGARRKKQFAFPTQNKLVPAVLRSACLFGPNGSGKSSLVAAMIFYREFIVSSAKDTQEGESIDVTPFKFDKKWREEPSEFEATFIHNDVFYQYGFAVDTDRVWSEWLFSRPKEPEMKMRALYQREYDAEQENYDWKISRNFLKGERELWKNATRDNALFLSTAVQLKSSSLKNPFDWIQNYFHVLNSIDRLSPGYTAKQIVEAGWSQKILNFLQTVDINIKSVKVQERVLRLADLPSTDTELLSEEGRNRLKRRLQDKKFVDILTYHHGADGELVDLDLDDESDGTQVMFSLAGPWLDILENGYTVVVDELHNSLHPLAMKFLVNLFHNSSLYNTNAQLIFTSHLTSVMSKGFMHKDQVWLLEKSKRDHSCLFPLSDFQIRDIAAYQKSYLDGRFGAIPKIQEFVSE